MRRQPTGRLLSVFAVGAIAAATLRPVPEQAVLSAATPLLCLHCGALGTVDVLLNVLLFVPAGIFLVLAVGRWWSGLVLAPVGLVALAAYSLAIELTQLQLARLDRACDVTDLVDNIVGAGIGFAIGLLLLPAVRPWRSRQRPEQPVAH